MSTVKEEQESLKVKIKKPSLKRPNDQVYKLDLTKKEEDAVQEQTTNEVPVRDESKVSEGVPEQNVEKETENTALRS